jgi:hypothetical protein
LVQVEVAMAATARMALVNARRNTGVMLRGRWDRCLPGSRVGWFRPVIWAASSVSLAVSRSGAGCDNHDRPSATFAAVDR